jgi:cyclophilin family peptidyl-prolyl cis-trans isomerase
MAKDGDAPIGNGSQFFITLRDLPYLDYKKVAFGRVVAGLDVLQAVAGADTCNERPQPIITIADCGQYQCD